MSDIIYNKFKEYMGDGTMDMDNDSFKIMLTTSSYTPAATHSVKADVDNEISGSGYTAGGATLQNVTWTESSGTVTFDATDISWTTATFTARYAVIYDDTPSDPLDPLVCLIDFGTDKSVTAGTFTIQFHANGIIALT